MANEFQSTHLSRGATFASHSSVDAFLFQSTHLSRGATDIMRLCAAVCIISIHAPLTRCDYLFRVILPCAANFNPRTSHEVRRATSFVFSLHCLFQSTHLSRGATCSSRPQSCQGRNFNPRTSHEVRHKPIYVILPMLRFQSTHLSRGATSHKGMVSM